MALGELCAQVHLLQCQATDATNVVAAEVSLGVMIPTA